MGHRKEAAMAEQQEQKRRMSSSSVEAALDAALADVHTELLRYTGIKQAIAAEDEEKARRLFERSRSALLEEMMHASSRVRSRMMAEAARADWEQLKPDAHTDANHASVVHEI